MLTNPFTATKLQVATYLLGVALFSISFLVFLNASGSFVVTDLIGQKENVGDVVGTLGFADELVALVACPFWGIVSDRLGVRTVTVMGYTTVGISLFVFVQAKNVYPQLLLARMFFSIGGAASATMVTAILPTMTAHNAEHQKWRTSDQDPASAINSEAVSTPGYDRLLASRQSRASRPATSQIAGFVGMFTGLGALIALGIFLPLPALFQKSGQAPASAVTDSFYVVGAIALAVAVSCALGLSGLAGEEGKGWKALFRGTKDGKIDAEESRQRFVPYSSQLLEVLRLGFTDIELILGYVGGFVARASSVAISLFLPLYVNAYFISSGLCKGDPHGGPHDVKERCIRAYTVAAALSGVSQLVALLCAPLFGYLDGRFRRFNAPLIVAAGAGTVGYAVLANIRNPDPSSREGGGWGIFIVMALLGISQIGAIVCSLSSLGRGIQGEEEGQAQPTSYQDGGDGAAGSHTHTENGTVHAGDTQEDTALLRSHLQSFKSSTSSRSHLKGTIAGLYSLAGGAGILLLTKLGGVLFDKLSPGAPFYMLAIFNAVLLLVGVGCSITQEVRNKERKAVS